MLRPYQERYRKRLVAEGLSEAEALALASKTVPSQRKSVNTPKGSGISGQFKAPPVREDLAASCPKPVAPKEADTQPGGQHQVTNQAEPAPPPNPRTADDVARIAAGQQLHLFEIAPWRDDVRGLPNDFARTAIFSARNKNVQREYFMRKPLYSLNEGVVLTVTGRELRVVDDEKVFNQLCELAKKHPAGEEFPFRFGDFVKALRWPQNSDGYRRLTDSLIRLQTFSIQLETPRLGGKLVSSTLAGKLTIHERNNKRRTYGTISLPREILFLFAGQHYTRQHWDTILDLKPTTRRLFDYVASHKKPNPLAMQKFAEIAFLRTEKANKLRELCRQMCDELVEKKLVKAAWVDEHDKINIVRDSQ